ncbi:MAG: T9SS type A sorting domain-containing protein [Bacteroidales bacterium]
MKKIVLGLILSLFMSSVFAQSLKLEIDGKDVNGKHITIYGLLNIDSNIFTIHAYMNLTNLTKADLLVSGTKTNIVMGEGAYSSWCGFENCFPDNFVNQTLAANASTGKTFYGEYTPNVAEDSAVVEYKIAVAGSETDFVVTTITFIVGEKPVSIEAGSKALTSVKVYPNPATSNVQFNFTLPTLAQAKLVFRNINGSVIKTENITGLNTKNVNLNGMATGLYFYSIEQNGATLSVGKLIVK